MRDVRIIALDLDGTLLDSGKNLSETNRAALAEAAGRGIHIVPTTGRFFGGMLESVRLVPRLAEMPYELISHHQLAALIACENRLIEPVQQMSFGARVIAVAHVFVEFLDNPLLRNGIQRHVFHPLLRFCTTRLS